MATDVILGFGGWNLNLSFKTAEECKQYIDNNNLPSLTEEDILKCRKPIAEVEILKALKQMDNNKSPGNDGIPKEFYLAFGKTLKKIWKVVICKAMNKEN